MKNLRQEETVYAIQKTKTNAIKTAKERTKDERMD